VRWLIFVPRRPTRDGVGHYLPDLVYGANDGIITTFAVVSGVVGADLSRTIILILGFANLFADGISMGASNYLARRSHAEPTCRSPEASPSSQQLRSLRGHCSRSAQRDP
jgi:vacuolar iron transporter family protein